MIRRIRRTLPWLGAVAALLLLALPVQADDIEPEPYVEEEVEPEPEPEPEVEAEYEEEDDSEYEEEPIGNIDLFLDVVLFRPLYLVRFVAGLPFFVFYPLTLGSGFETDVVAQLWTDPFEATFRRPLGEPVIDY